MVSGMWGRKIGMTQVFVNDKIVPVTAIDLAHWIVTHIKSQEHDGYNAIQVGCLRKRYTQQQFDQAWLKNKSHYFVFIREITFKELPEGLALGQAVDFYKFFTEGDLVHATGITKGRGFAGVVRRHDFAGARSSHGSKMGNRTGALSFMRSQGRVIKGKKMPGHMGTVQRSMRNLSLVQLRPEDKVVLIKGSVPGHSGSLVYISKV